MVDPQTMTSFDGLCKGACSIYLWMSPDDEGEGRDEIRAGQPQTTDIGVSHHCSLQVLMSSGPVIVYYVGEEEVVPNFHVVGLSFSVP